jgi:hypothetical protein
MPSTSSLVARSGDLKGQLVDYALQPRFDRAFRRAQQRRFGSARTVVESERTNFIDWFVLQERLPDGRTVVQHFVDEHPPLSDQDRALLLGWRDVVEGLFEVKRREGETLLVENLVDELTYRVHSNSGTAVFRQMPRGSFIATRLVPVGDEWMLSGMTSVLPAETRADVYRETSAFAVQHPELVFRNPEKLERGWELQRLERRHFIAFFGADLVVLPGREVKERILDDEGQSAADRVREDLGAAPPPLDFPGPVDFSKAETVGVICDEVEGLNFFVNFGQLVELFADPALAAERKYGQALLEYLSDPSISPLPFRRLAAQDPERASQVFQRVLRQPGFSWERDGEALLRRYKTSFFEKPLLPASSP